MALLTISELARRSAVPATTLRYYDELGILPAERTASNHRRYPVEALERLQLIRLCRQLGCSLDEVAAILGPAGGDVRRDVATRKLAELEATLSQLEAVKRVLAHLAGCRHTPNDADACREATRQAWAATAPDAGSLTPYGPEPVVRRRTVASPRGRRSGA